MIRTQFLRRYLDDAEPRSTIQAATNKSEAFNGYAKWAFCGGEGVIPHHRRAGQRTYSKCNHLIANCLIFYNVHLMSAILHQLTEEGMAIEEQAVAALSLPVSAQQPLRALSARPIATAPTAQV